MIQQDYLPRFLEEEATERESTIPKEAKIRHLRNMYWRFRKYQSKTGDIEGITRVEKIRSMMECVR